MTFTLDNITNSLAGVLRTQYPEYPVYTNPNQQGTSFPCFFIFFMPSAIESQVDERFIRDLGIDIVFVQQRNIVNGNEKIHAIAGYLDENLELFPYFDGSGAIVPVRTYERQWQTEDEELHYKFHIKQRVSVPRTSNPMERLEDNHANIK